MEEEGRVSIFLADRETRTFTPLALVKTRHVMEGLEATIHAVGAEQLAGEVLGVLAALSMMPKDHPRFPDGLAAPLTALISPLGLEEGYSITITQAC